MKVRPRRILLAVALVPLFIWALWIVGANAALFAAPRIIGKREPVQMSFRAFTLLPGVVHVRDFRLRAEDRWVQWGLDVKRGTVCVDISSLTQRTFRARRVNADGVKFRMRFKKTAEELAELPANSYPNIPGFAPEPLRNDDAFPQNKPLVAPWTIEMDDVTARSEELWVDGVRYEGPAMASGKWAMKFDAFVSVGPTQLSLQKGVLKLRGVEAANGVTGVLTAGLLPFNPRVVRDGEIVDQLNVKGQLTGNTVADLADGAKNDPGVFSADLNIEQGALQPGTSVHAQLPNASKRLGAVRLKGDLDAAAEVSADGKLSWTLRGQKLHVSAPAIGGLSVNAGVVTVTSSPVDAHLRTLSLPTRASVDVPNAKLNDLRSLNALIPDPLKLRIERGQGQVRARLSVNLERRTADGELTVNAKSLIAKHKERTLSGGVKLKVKFNGVAPELKRLALSNGTLSLQDMKVISGDKDTKPWSGTVKFSDASVDARRKRVFQAHVRAEFSDARPLFRAMVDELNAPGWTRGLLSPNNVTAEGNVTFGKSLVHLRDVEARVGRVDVRTGALMEGKDQRAVVEISLGKLRVGVERVGRRTLVKPFSNRDWYERKRAAAAL